MSNGQKPIENYEVVDEKITETAVRLQDNVTYYLRRLEEAQMQLHEYLRKHGIEGADIALLVKKVKINEQ